MRFNGTIRSWNDERGFGFIEATQGGEEVFVHIKAFHGLRGRPQVNQRVSFEVETGSNGRKRAVRVEIVPFRRAGRQPGRDKGQVAWGTPARLAFPLFAVALLLGYVFGSPPPWVPLAYVAASVVTFLTYAFDKSAASHSVRRTSERTLHVLALVGGWPGALLAQQMLRHKSSKAEFRVVFWATVVLNIVAFGILASPVAGMRLPL